MVIELHYTCHNCGRAWEGTVEIDVVGAGPDDFFTNVWTGTCSVCTPPEPDPHLPA